MPLLRSYPIAFFFAVLVLTPASLLSQNTVQLSTGQVAFPITLYDLPGRNGPGIRVQLWYDSSVRLNATTINRDTPTGVAGLGWTFPRERILRMTNGTGNTEDDSYYLYSGGGVNELIPLGESGGVITFQTRTVSNYKVAYTPAQESWTVTNTEGIRYIYGGGLGTSGNTKFSAGSSVEWGVRWGNWIGSGNPTHYTPPGGTQTAQEQIAVAWNLSQTVNLWGETTHYEYVQVNQQVASGKIFTKASYLSRIKTVDRTIAFEYSEKTSQEYADPHVENAEPDAYQERYDTRYLESATLLAKNGQVLRTVSFEYELLNSGSMTKRLLTSISEVRPDGSAFGPPRVFDYWGQDSGDGVSVSQTSDANVYNADKGALYGALKQVTLPSGAKTSYFYDQKNITTGERSLAISAPDPTWADPHIYYGVDYAVVLWRKQNNYSLSLYDWQGRWVPRWDGSESGGARIDINTTDPDSLRVSVSQNFFAVAAKNGSDSLRLFWRNPGAPGRWSKQSVELSLSKFQLRAGQNFVALLDLTGDPSLRRYTFQDTNFKTESVVSLPKSPYTIQKMDARKNFIVTISGGAVQAARPILQLFHLDEYAVWQSGASLEMDQFFPPPGQTSEFQTDIGLLDMTLIASESFAGLQAYNEYIQETPGGTMCENGVCQQLPSTHTTLYTFKHFAFPWSEDFSKVSQHNLAQMTLDDDNIAHGVNMVVIGDAIHLSRSNDLASLIVDLNKAHAYRFNGANWVSASFDNALINVVYGYDLLSISSRSGATKSEVKIKTYNANSQAWSANQLTYNEDDDTTLTLILDAVFGFANSVLAIIPIEGWLLDVFLNASLIGGQLGSEWLVHKFIHPDPQIGYGGLNYFAAHNDVYYRGANGNFTKIGTLSASANDLYAHPPRISANAISYMTRVGDVHHNYVAILKNGVFYNHARIEPNEATNATLSTNPTDKQPLLGPMMVVAYPRAQNLKNAGSLTLFRIDGKEVTGTPSSYVVSRVRTDDGFETRTTYYQYDTNHAAMVPGTDKTIYNRVVTTQAQSSLSRGFTETYFYNGIDSDLPFAPDEDTNAADYPQLLAGEVYLTRACGYDASASGQCDVVSSNTTTYRVYTPALLKGRQPFFTRAVRQTAVLDGRETQKDLTYDETTGFLEKVSAGIYDGAGQEETHVTKYAYITDRYPGDRSQLQSLNLISPVVETNRTVTVAGSDETTVSIEVSPWRDWSESAPCSAVANGRALWSPVSQYVAVRNAPGEFYFESGQPQTPANWLRKNEITRVDCSYGLPLETLDSAGKVGSYVYDAAYRKPVAVFAHADVSRNEAAFTSLEEYEDLSAFQITGTIDAERGHIGLRSLAGDAPSIALKRFQTNGAAAYVLGVFVRPSVGKTCRLQFGDAEQDSAQGTANGQWFYATVTTTQASPLPSVSCPNGGAIDDFAVYPVDSHFAGAAYDPLFENSLGIVKPNGQAQRFFYDSRNRMMGATNGAGEMLHAAAGLSARCNPAKDDCAASETVPFSPARPNESLSLTARGGGAWFDFNGMTRPEVSASFAFQKDTSSSWGVEEGRLVLAEQNVATLKDTPEGSYAVRVRVSQYPLIDEPYTYVLPGSNLQSNRSPALADVPGYGLVLYAAGNGGTMYSYDAETGNQIAQSDDGLLQEESNLQIDEDGNVVFTDQYGALVAYNFRLQEVWRNIGPQAYSRSQAPVSHKAKGLIYARTVNNQLVAINTSPYVGKEIGEPVWHFTDAEVRSEPSLGDDGTIYFTGPGGLFALNSDGEKLFSCSDQQIFTENAPPVSRQNVVYAQSGGYIYAYDGYSGQATCSIKWDTRSSGLFLSNAGAIRIAGNGAVLVAQYNILYAFSENDGSLLWQRELPEAVIGMPAIHASGRIIVFTPKTMYALAPDDGAIQWDYSGPGDPPDPEKYYRTYGSAVVSGDGSIFVFDSEKSTLVHYKLRPALQNESSWTWATLFNGPRNSGSAEGRLAVREPAEEENGPVRVSIGSVSVHYENGTYQFYDDDRPVGVPVESEFSEDWLFVAFDDAALFYAGGRPLLSAKFSHAIEGALKLASPDAKHVAEFADLLIFDDPMLDASYTDGAGRERQAQSLESGDNIVLTESLYDDYGRAYIATRPAPNTGRFGYRPNFVTGVDASSGVMTGDVANYYSTSGLSGFGPGPSNDQGYPYHRNEYESNPVSRIVEVGEPGKDLAIRPGNDWTTQFQYGSTAASNALLQRTAGSGAPEDGYLSYSSSIPWGDDRFMTISLANGGGQITAAQKGTVHGNLTDSNADAYDAGGERTNTAKTPDDYAGKARAPSLNATVDVAGRRTQATRTDSGTRRFAYDIAGRLRFIDTPQGDQIRYRKYDRIGRVVETGVCNASWSTAEANVNNANWPTSGNTIRRSFDYDTPGSQPGDNLVGRLAEVRTYQTIDGAVKTVIDSYSYDIQGQIIRHTVSPAGLPARHTTYEYDAAGNIRAIIYPEVSGIEEPYKNSRIVYTYDRLGRTTGVGLPPDGDGNDRSQYFAGYVYYADGSIRTETNNQGKVTRSFGYVSDGGIALMDDRFVRQSFQYIDSEGRLWGRNIARETFDFKGDAFSGSGLPAPPQSYDYSYWYDSTGRLFHAVCSAQTYDVMVSSNVQQQTYDGYDANGNISHLYSVEKHYNATYVSHKNQIDTFGVQGGQTSTYQYNASGRITGVTRGGSQISSFTYAPYDGLTLSARNAGGNLQFWYGADGKRVLRQSGDVQTVYVYGLGAGALMEFPHVGGQNQSFLRHIYGPTGIIASGDNTQYHFYIKDRLGSTKIIYDESLKVFAYYNYLPFGGFMDGYSAETDNRFRFRYTGQEYDVETSLYNYRARLYDPQTARFLTPDPMLDGPSPYVYARNDPANYTDPTGLWPGATAFRLTIGVLRAGAYAGLGALIGYSIDGKEGAKWGAIAGAAFGGLGMLPEVSRDLWSLRWWGEARDYPVIAYGPTGFLNPGAGRVAAEDMAINLGIPRHLWDAGLPGDTGLLRELGDGALNGVTPDAHYNGRVIMVAHGTPTGSIWYRNAEGGHRIYLGGEGLANRLGAESWNNINRLDLSACWACRSHQGFDRSLAGRLRHRLSEAGFGLNPGHRIEIRASDYTTSPINMRAWRAGGSRTAVYGLGYEVGNYLLFGILPTHYVDEAAAAGNRYWRMLEAAAP